MQCGTWGRGRNGAGMVHRWWHAVLVRKPQARARGMRPPPRLVPQHPHAKPPGYPSLALRASWASAATARWSPRWRKDGWPRPPHKNPRWTKKVLRGFPWL